jgi:hypothetical protein
VDHLRIVARRPKGKEKSIATTNYGDGSLEDVEPVIHVEPALFERGPAGAVQRSVRFEMGVVFVEAKGGSSPFQAQFRPVSS